MATVPEVVVTMLELLTPAEPAANEVRDVVPSVVQDFSVFFAFQLVDRTEGGVATALRGSRN